MKGTAISYQLRWKESGGRKGKGVFECGWWKFQMEWLLEAEVRCLFSRSILGMVNIS